MTRIQISILVLVSTTFLGSREIDNFSKVPKSLKRTNWTSQFYHYHNFYRLDTDSTGYSEDGRIARSLPFDFSIYGIRENEILYAQREKFKYGITDTILTIEYLTWRPNDTAHTRIFYYRPEHKDWLSEHEYSYGKERLRKGRQRKVSKY